MRPMQNFEPDSETYAGSAFALVESEEGGDEATVDCIIDNRTPRKLEHVVVFHKFLGNDPPVTVMLWDTVESNSLSDVQTFHTKTSVRYFDWWQVTFRFGKLPYEKDDERAGCPICLTDDGVCEARMTRPGKKWFKALTDPRMLLNAAIYTGAAVAGVAITAATWGAGAIFVGGFAAGILHGVTEGIVMGVLSDRDTSDYYSCTLRKKDIRAARDEGRKLHLVIRDEQDENGDTETKVDWEMEKASDDSEEVELNQKCSIGVSDLPCRVDLTEEEKLENVEHVAVKINNLGPSKITRLALVQKYDPTGPSLLEWTDEIEAGTLSAAREVSTMTNARIRTIGKSDWWIAAWQDEDDPCLVKSTLDLDLMRDVFKGLRAGLLEDWKFVVADGLTGMLGPVAGTAASLLLNGRKYLESRRDAVATDLTQLMFGEDLISTLSKGRTDKNGFFTNCPLKEIDVTNTANGIPVTIEIDRAQENVTFKFGSKECYADIVALRCIYTRECMEREDCKELGAKGWDNAPPPKGMTATGIVGGAAKGVGELGKDLGTGLVKGVGQSVGIGKDIVHSAGDGIKTAGHVAVDGAKKVGHVAVDGVKQVGQTAVGHVDGHVAVVVPR